MKSLVLGASALLVSGSALAAMPQTLPPEAVRAMVEAGRQIALGHPSPQDWTGVGGPEEPEIMMVPASARADAAVLAPKDASLPPMEVGRSHAPEPGDKDAAQDRSGGDVQDRGGDGRTAEAMRSGSAWAQYGGMSDYYGVGGPEEDEPRLYPPCRSRSDDRCQQGR